MVNTIFPTCSFFSIIVCARTTSSIGIYRSPSRVSPTVAWMIGRSLPASISGHTFLYISIATSCLNVFGRERSVEPVIPSDDAAESGSARCSPASSHDDRTYTRSLQESNNHHATVLREQLDILLRVVTADVIENHIDTPM